MRSYGRQLQEGEVLGEESEKVLLKVLIPSFSSMVSKFSCWLLEQCMYIAGLSLRGGGRGFPPVTKNVAPGYFHRKIEEK